MRILKQTRSLTCLGLMFIFDMFEQTLIEVDLALKRNGGRCRSNTEIFIERFMWVCLHLVTIGYPDTFPSYHPLIFFSSLNILFSAYSYPFLILLFSPSLLILLFSTSPLILYCSSYSHITLPSSYSLLLFSSSYSLSILLFSHSPLIF